MSTDTQADRRLRHVVAFGHRPCGLPLGRAWVISPGEPIIDIRSDERWDFESAKRRAGGAGLERRFVKLTGRQTWQRIEHEGATYLVWTEGCRCQDEPSPIVVAEAATHERIMEAKLATDVRPLPVLVP
jgi:hypothetical protein